MSYGWPGNVRQLKNVDRAHGRALRRPQADAPTASPPRSAPPAAAGETLGGMNNLVGISIEQAEKELIRNTLKLVNGNREQAAKILGIGERTLYRKIKEYDL